MYQIIRIEGLGVMESPSIEIPTDMIFNSKEDADKKAEELWLSQTTKEDRESGWCGLHFRVKKITPQ